MVSFERTNVRTASLAALGGVRFDLVVADLSFISLRTVAGALANWTHPRGDLVVLVKPQFEAGRREVSRGRGVIREPGVWRGAVVDVIAAFDAAGATMMGVMVSPLRGADGNVEFLAHLRLGSAGSEAADTLRAIDAAGQITQSASGLPARSRRSAKVEDALRSVACKPKLMSTPVWRRKIP